MIQDKGITPEVVVEQPPDATEDQDLQLDRAIEILGKEIAKVG
jgi:C-terminal processing protease CtpA/Prc